MIKYLGKCVLIELEKEKILVVGDLHVGYEQALRLGGLDLGKRREKEIIKEFEDIFEKEKKIDKVVLLGDLKHDFSYLSEDERNILSRVFDYFLSKVKEIIIVRGNHDNYLLNLSSKKGILVKEFFVQGEFCFLHGDKDFEEIMDKKIKIWLMGHLHPAINLYEGNKEERYKCFLYGKYKDKKVIILPSFSSYNEGMDVKEGESNLAWDFNLKNFEVKVVGENLEVLDFGKLKNIK